MKRKRAAIFKGAEDSEVKGRCISASWEGGFDVMPSFGSLSLEHKINTRRKSHHLQELTIEYRISVAQEPGYPAPPARPG